MDMVQDQHAWEVRASGILGAALEGIAGILSWCRQPGVCDNATSFGQRAQKTPQWVRVAPRAQPAATSTLYGSSWRTSRIPR